MSGTWLRASGRRHSVFRTAVELLGILQSSSESVDDAIGEIGRFRRIDLDEQSDCFVEFLSIHVPIITATATGTSL